MRPANSAIDSPRRTVGRRRRTIAAPPPPPRTGLCAAWSHHAAELAVPIGAGLQRWEESPSTAAMIREDLLARVLPGVFLPPDLLRTAIERALALGCALGGQLQSYHVIAGPSAAWVLLGGRPPAPAELLSSAHRGSIIGATVRTARLRPHEVETIGGAPVTSPVRTAADLLRFCPDHVADPALRGLLGSGHLTERAMHRQLQVMGRHPGARAARARWEVLLGGLAPAA
ncbi:hypothetical protein [Brachybacterium fresconis]|uniref:Transcriptional regulator n=1 Tax=Brachybacterium fresconis TaxID=173363 RepID=A0ABS4YEC1_9MICO|nr:hypothetical protein [Brachybacterium fresconis]MBP2407141.1 hypothetical protein [Brachybacterium fresconis]